MNSSLNLSFKIAAACVQIPNGRMTPMRPKGAPWRVGKLFDAQHNYDLAWRIVAIGDLVGAGAVYAVSNASPESRSITASANKRIAMIQTNTRWCHMANFVSSMRKREAENVAACRDCHVLDSIDHVTHR